MKFPHTTLLAPFRSVPLCLTLGGIAAQAAPLFSEGFDDDQAKVKLVQRTSAAASFVDYSNFERAAPAATGTLKLSIPEAPNRIPGSAATKGVVLSALYGTSDRSIMMLAADAAEGSPIVFNGNYRVTFDMWLSLDPAAVAASAGTTEGGFWTVNSPGSPPPARLFRSSSLGNWGWLSTEGGAGTGAAGSHNGDASFYTNGTHEDLRENLTKDPALFSQAFPLGTPIPKTPNNQWTTVEVSVTGGSHIRVKFNGVLFFERDTTLTEGAAGFGYDDLFSSATANAGASFSPNWQFGLFDNFVVESIPSGIPVLEVSPQTAFATAADNSAVLGDFLATNNGSADLQILSGVIEGPDAAQFAFPPEQSFPMTVVANNSATVSVNFNSALPNGLKTARLVLTTNDPNAPTITLPLQARRKVSTVEGPAFTNLSSVSTQTGSSTGQITVTNSSENPVTLSAVALSGANASDFTLTSALPVTVAPGEPASLDVKFTPTGDMGIHNASFAFTTNDPNQTTLSLNVRARYAYGPPLLAHYKLDETEGTAWVDDTGVSPNASVQVREQPFGYGATSLLPNGQGTAVHLTPADSSTTGNFAYAKVPHLPNVSFSLWIRPEAKTSATNRTILQRSSLFSQLGTLYSLNLSPTGQLFFDMNKLNSGVPAVVQTEDEAIKDGQTYHIVVTHSDEDGFLASDGSTPLGTRTRLYVNGALASEEDPSAPVGYTDYTFSTTSEGLYIGSATSAGSGFMGDLDDLQVYSVELTPEQVAGMYQQPGKTAFNLETIAVPFDITSMVYDSTAGTITLTWSSQANAVYQVLQSATLSGFTAIPALNNIPSAGATTSAVITGITPGAKNFYRIGRVSP